MFNKKSFFKKSLMFFVSIPAIPTKWLISFKTTRFIYLKLFEFYLLKLSFISGLLFTFHARPKYSDHVFCSDIFYSNVDYSEFAVLLQGPIVSKGSKFTLETCKLYLKLFPGVKLILSTWDQYSFEDLELFRQRNIYLVLSKKPIISGSHNINYQIISTLAGIKKAEELSCRYILKSRTDQRLYSSNTLKYLKYYLKKYPPASDLKCSGRIIEPGVTICKFRPWSMCDMFQFGYVSDLKKMWNLELDSRSQTEKEYSVTKHSVRKIVEDNIAEIYVHRSYAKSIGLSSGSCSRDYYEFIKKAIVIFDKEQVDLFWLKYSSLEYGWMMNPLYSRNQLLSRINHSDWLRIMADERINYDFLDEHLDKLEN